MDESCLRFVHGIDQRQRDLAPVLPARRGRPAHFWRIQRPGIRGVHLPLPPFRRGVHSYFKDDDRSTAAEAGAKRPHGCVTESASKISNDLQKAGYSLF